MLTSTSHIPEEAGPWERLERLFGSAALQRLQRAHVLVVGLGGVGSWAVEALARSGVGCLTLVDHDSVCLSNLNRQLPALRSTLGMPKAVCLGERVKEINPECRVSVLPLRFTAQTAERVLGTAPDVVIDAIDSVGEKALLLAMCKRVCRSVICACGAGGRRDPVRIRVADLAQVQGDALARAVRARLRRVHGISAINGRFDIPAVYSLEPAAPPATTPRRAEGALRHSVKPGTCCAVTGSFGFVCATLAIEILLSERSSAGPTEECSTTQ
ncbi:MAG: tRNA threonylcarbamoyladenosine dehydratase [bacterium]|nr:tRNA threonylcarbamoyladenosine dehydratase [bacterium]